MIARTHASRREALKTAALGATGVATAIAVARTAGTAGATKQLTPEHANEGAPIEPTYLADLVGALLGEYSVVAVGAFERGGVPVDLSHRDGLPFRVDVLRADPTGPNPGIAAASAHAVFLRNGGDGRTATDECMGLGAMALAAELARREQAGLTPPSELLTMEERAALHTLAARVT